MLNYYFICICIALFSFSGCVPVNSCFESARMLEKGQLEVRANYSPYIYTENSESDYSNYNYGAGIGYGISEKWNFKMRYELITFPDNGEDFYHYTDVAVKYSIIHTRMAVSLPIGVYAAEGTEPTFVISPRLLLSYPYNEHFEMTGSVKSDFFLEEDTEIPIGFNLGFGISKNLTNWAIRPEAGYMFDPGDKGTSFTFGIGLSYNFSLIAIK